MKTKMTINELEQCFTNAQKDNATYVAVKVQMQGFTDPEIIINTSNNFESKLEYYKKAYNEDLTLKAFNGIKIIDFDHANSLDELEYSLLSHPTE